MAIIPLLSDMMNILSSDEDCVQTVDSQLPTGEFNKLPAPAVVALAAASVLSACGGESTPSASAPQALTDGSSSLGGQITQAQASRFLMQAQLFSTPDDIQQVIGLGFKEWLRLQFEWPVQKTAWDWLVERGYHQEEFKTGGAFATDFFCWKDLCAAPDTLRKRVALVLSEILVVSVEGVSGNYVHFFMAAYWDLLNQHAFGNFRQLLESMTLNPAMGKYLNTLGNVKANSATGQQPDENYAREVMQLFTIGLYEMNLDGSIKRDAAGAPIETYSQDSVSNLAQVFTGWELDPTGVGEPDQPNFARNPMKLAPAKHAMQESRFLNTSIAANTAGEAALKIALDTLFMHPNVAPFWAKQLIQKMVTSNPSAAYIGRVARVFENNGRGIRGDLRAVIESVLLDPEARQSAQAAGATFGKLREPVARFIQWARTFKAQPAEDSWRFGSTSDPATRLAQSPLRSPSVFNFFRPNYVPPDPVFVQAQLVGPEFQLFNEVSLAGYVNFMTTVIRNGTLLKANYTDLIALAPDPQALINHLALILTANQIPENTLRDLAQAVSTIEIKPNNNTLLLRRVQACILMIMACPQYLIQK